MTKRGHVKSGSHSLLLSRPVVLGGLVIAFGLVVATALLSGIATQGVAAANASIGRVQTTLIALNQLRATLADAEAGQRGFILTGAPEYLEPYERAVHRFRREIAELRSRFLGNPVQQATMADIERLGAEKFAEMSRTIELRREGGVGAAINIVDSERSHEAMNQLRRHLRVLETREFSELATRSDHASARAQQFQLISRSMIGIAVVLAGIAAALLLRRVRELERLIPVCAWTHRVRDNDKWLTFEEYLAKRFRLRFTHGISDEAAQKMRADAVELSQAMAAMRVPTVDSAPPMPVDSTPPFSFDSTPPFPFGSTPPIPFDSRPPMEVNSTPPIPFESAPPIGSDSTPPIKVGRSSRAAAAAVRERA